MTNRQFTKIVWVNLQRTGIKSKNLNLIKRLKSDKADPCGDKKVPCGSLEAEQEKCAEYSEQRKGDCERHSSLPLSGCVSSFKPIYPLKDKPKPKIDFVCPAVQSKRNYYIINGFIISSAGIVLYLLYKIKDDIIAWFKKKLIPPEPKKPPKKPKKPDFILKRPQLICKNPKSTADIPDDVEYLIVGGGTAAAAAFKEILAQKPEAKVLVLAEEPYLPYMRPPLDKDLTTTADLDLVNKLNYLNDKGVKESAYLEPPSFYGSVKALNLGEKGGVAVATGHRVVGLNTDKQLAFLEDGKAVHYRRCLLATGARPKRPDVFEKVTDTIKNHITYFRTAFDAIELNHIVNQGALAIAVVGGGLIGTELSVSLKIRGKDTGLRVFSIIPEGGVLTKLLPKYLSDWLTNEIEKTGVEIIKNAKVEELQMKDDFVILGLNTGKKVPADHVVVGVGIEPNLPEVVMPKLEVDHRGGVVVNSELLVKQNLYAAGDVISYFDVCSKRTGIEHHGMAVQTGTHAGRAMATCKHAVFRGKQKFGVHITNDLFFTVIGTVCSKMPTVGVFAKALKCTCAAPQELKPQNVNCPATDKPLDLEVSQPDPEPDFRRGVIFYLNEEEIVNGVILWNLEAEENIAVARNILVQEKKYEDLNEVAKLFKIHS